MNWIPGDSSRGGNEGAACLLAVVTLSACGGRVGDSMVDPAHALGDGGIVSSGAPDSAGNDGSRGRASCGTDRQPSLLGLLARDDQKVELRSIDPNTGHHLPYPDPGTPNVLDGLGATVRSPVLVADHFADRLYAFDSDSQRIITIDAKSGVVIRTAATTHAEHLFLTASGELLALSSEGGVARIDAELGTHTPYPGLGTFAPQAGLSLLTHAYNAETGDLYLESLFYGLVEISIPDGSIAHGQSMALEPSPIADCVGMSLYAHEIVAVCPSREVPNSWSLQSIGGPSIANFPNPLVPNPIIGMTDAIAQGRTAEASDPDSNRLYLMGTRAHDDPPQLFVIDTSGKTASKSYPLGNFQAFVIVCR